MASKTLQPIPELSLEEINNNAVVPRLPQPPLLLASDLRAQTLELRFLLWRTRKRRLH